jgi:hypothetical protein
MTGKSGQPGQFPARDASRCSSVTFPSQLKVIGFKPPITIPCAETQPKIALGHLWGNGVMAKKARKAKAAGKKKVGKKTARRARAVVGIPALSEAHPLNSLLVTALSKHVFQSLADNKSDAVNACVNAEMDRVTDSWNDSGHMDKDYKQNPRSMRAFLSDVQVCLQTKGFDFNMNDPGLIQACVSAAVYQLKLLVYGRTK